ncbi:MAG: RluA family pseudouridine synthase [Aureispira sp.]|nr:RluA family pseudouridine synthase [Aureispira sp.]
MNQKEKPIKENCFIPFMESLDAFSLPEKFTFPFYYQPHPLSLLAANKLQEHLKTQTDWEHNFGLDSPKDESALGKMFGVLVVQTKDKQLGYLAAFSGKLADSNHHPFFVPPVFDILKEDDFFIRESKVLTQINNEIKALEANPSYLVAQQYLEEVKALVDSRLSEKRKQMKMAKDRRKAIRAKQKEKLSPTEYKLLEEELKNESRGHQFCYKRLAKFWKARVAWTEELVNSYSNKIKDLKHIRKTKSAAVQKQLFSQYCFINQNKKEKSLYDIFLPTINDIPPSGAGECAAPKLLQHAFLHNMKPIAMAEFWWGKSPKSEVRKHGYFYPACRGKCEPILSHMLEGIDMDANPMMSNPAEGKTLEIVYEDEFLLVVNKPAEFLSVPGKNVQDSVMLRMKQRYPTATGPLVVHRLDMSTSGLMLIAKTKELHKELQHQFIKRTIKKRYVALLEGLVEKEEGFIDLPLRVDLDNRPQQLVCYEHGKSARTKWKVIEQSNQQTRVYFYPITGRTHQLRVHAAHPMGLNTPIVGDDIYGQKKDRLLLHAESIDFLHPITKEQMVIKVDPEF